MIPSERAPLPGSREACAFVLLSLFAVVVLTPIIYMGLYPSLGPPVAYTLPVFLALCGIVVFQFARAGDAAPPLVLTIVGLAYIIGGATFDIVVTLVHSPDLALEGNPIAAAYLIAAIPCFLSSSSARWRRHTTFSFSVYFGFPSCDIARSSSPPFVAKSHPCYLSKRQLEEPTSPGASGCCHCSHPNYRALITYFGF